MLRKCPLIIDADTIRTTCYSAHQNDMTDDLVEFWKNARFTSAAYIHEADRPIITQYHRRKNLDYPADFES